MQPQSPDPQFDFMLKNQPQAKRTLGLPALTKPLKIGLAVVCSLILVIIVGSVLGKPSGSTTNISGVLARGAEIQRVTAEVQQLNLQDSATQALAVTVNTVLASDQAQLEQYLSNNHAKISPAQLAADTDKSTDTQMQSASQNNNLDQTYITYLQQSLAKYRSDIQTAYNAAGPNGKAILKDSLDGVNTLLSSSPLKS
ncbi:MAG TPA: hypothetical protein VFH37_03140 [Candidatus Saccharimonadales bacterium]|nr:hypothetical protein [Candidatus Saccharimonadales bacterium]